jgi:uncharacterized protein YvpB
MKIKIVSVFLGLLAAFFAIVSDYTETLSREEERMAELSEYQEIGALRNAKYSGYTIDEIIAGFSSLGTAPQKSLVIPKRLIEVPMVNQYPLLPVGCEIASAVSLAGFLGYNISLETFTDTYITHTGEAPDFGFTRIKAGTPENPGLEDILYGPDPEKIFVGNPYGWGYGCKAPVITEAMNRFFETAHSDFLAVTMYGLNEPDFKRLIAGGVPVIVWATLDMEPFEYRNPTKWTITETGEELQWYKGSHTLLMCGYDDDVFYFMDPNDKESYTPYSRDLFMTRYEEAGAQAVVVVNSAISVSE